MSMLLGTKLLGAQHESPGPASVRILISELDAGIKFDTGSEDLKDFRRSKRENMTKDRMFDAIGLYLRLNPRFFRDTNTICESNPARIITRCRVGDIFSTKQRQAVIGDAIVTIARDYMPKITATVPVIVIAGLLRRFYHPYYPGVDDDPELSESSPFERSIVDEHKLD